MVARLAAAVVTLSRRRFLGTAAALSAVGAGIGGCGVLRQQTGEGLRSEVPLPQRFAVPLPVPALAVPVRSTVDTDHFEITQRRATVELLPGVRTPILGYDGVFPGPTIVSRAGRRTVVRHVNELGVPTVVHLHGGHVPAASDGFPADVVRPGEAREYEYPMRQRGATLWYHDHRMDFTGPAVYRGLAGFHLVHDPDEDRLGLPSGERDVPIMLADRAFDEEGALRYPAVDASMTGTPGVEAAYTEGVLGDVVLVNGAAWPLFEVDAARYRLRLLNASNARRYELTLRPGAAELVQVGSDGGLLARPVSRGSVVLAPGERVDIVVDFARYPVGTEITLHNRLGDRTTAEIMRFVVTRAATDDSTVPDVLGEIEPYQRSAATVRREFRFTRESGHSGWVVNKRRYDPARVDADPALGTLELWRFGTDVHHPVHLHLDPFQVVRRGSRGPGASDAGWKDTVDVRPGEVVEVLVRFTDYAGTYVMHCHNLEHEDMMMMANFATH